MRGTVPQAAGAKPGNHRPVNTSTYARRQLNPFAGVLQVVESGVARAFSANGILWRIQTVANRPDHTWRSDAGPAPVQQFFNWGMWSARRGMQQVTANPILDIGFMSGAAEELVSVLRREIDRLPFALKDHHELWACDRHGNPLALLDSVITAAEMQQISTHRCASARRTNILTSHPVLPRRHPLQQARGHMRTTWNTRSTSTPMHRRGSGATGTSPSPPPSSVRPGMTR